MRVSPLTLAAVVIVLGVTGVGGATSTPRQSAPMSLDSSRGFILKAHRVAFGPLMADGYMSQADLATLAHVSNTKISRVERGLDTLTAAQQDSIAVVFIRIMRARVHPLAIEQFNAVVLRNLSRQ